jgi:hypothetical protein
MRNLQYILSLIITLLLFACGNKGGNQSNSETPTGDSNEILYNQIMDIHDEVMPKTEELYNISKQLKTNLKDATTDAEKDLLQNQINYFDSVNTMMMDWMHEFRPLPDTTNQETARSYYENHLEKVKLVREAILTAVDKGKN